MYPYIFGLEFLDSYGVMLCIGVLGFACAFFYKVKKLNIEVRMREDLILLCIISGCFMYISAFGFDSLFHSIEEKKLVKGGITFLGGLVGAVAAFSISYITVIKHERHNLLYFINMLIPGLVLAHAFGRIGCFLSGCCYGMHTDSFLAVTFPKGSDAYFRYGPNNSVLPTQLIEAGFLFILFGILFSLKRNQFVTYLFSYGIFRFIIEFYRGDDRGSLFKYLSPSQFLSLVLIFVGIIILIKRPNQERLEPVYEIKD